MACCLRSFLVNVSIFWTQSAEMPKLPTLPSEIAAAAILPPNSQNTQTAFIRSSFDVELTYPAFRLPGVYDRKYESNNNLYKSPNGYRRVFLHHQQFPPNRRYALPDKDPLPTKRSKPGVTNKEKENLHSVLQGYTEQRSGGDNADLELIGLGSVAPTFATSQTDDNADTYAKVRQMIFGNARKINLSRLERRDANFSSVVDIDDEAFESYVTDDLAGRLGEGDFFRLTMLLFIIANSIVIGLQTDQNLSTAFSSVFSALDAVFLAVFTMEILFKWYYGFLDFWKTGWNVVDFLLVFISFIGPLISFVESGRILLMIRIVRSFRSLRSISALNGMYTVLQTIMRSLPDMANIVLLLLIVMFIFAVVGVTIFGSILPERFGDLGSNMFTLFIIITQDGWVEIFDELEKRNQFVPAAIYFVLFIIIGAFVITNLIVAVVVTNLELTYANIKKANRQKYRNLKSIAMSNGPPPVTKTMNRNVRQINEVKEDIWKKQIPYEIPEFNRITQSKLETYFLILMIIEENLKEYVDLKEKLNEILLELKLINSDIQTPAPPEEDEAEDEGELGDAELDVGDPLSRLIRGK